MRILPAELRHRSLQRFARHAIVIAGGSMVREEGTAQYCQSKKHGEGLRPQAVASIFHGSEMAAMLRHRMGAL